MAALATMLASTVVAELPNAAGALPSLAHGNGKWTRPGVAKVLNPKKLSPSTVKVPVLTASSPFAAALNGVNPLKSAVRGMTVRRREYK